LRKKNLKTVFAVFSEKPWFSIGPHLHRLRPPSKFVRLSWKIFWRYLRPYARGKIELFRKSHFLFFLWQKYIKVRVQDHGLDLQNPVNPVRKVENENSRFYLWRIPTSICGKNFSPIGQSYRGVVSSVNWKNSCFALR
jgi:hypothetical protein